MKREMENKDSQTYTHTDIKKERERDRQTGRQAGRQTGRQADYTQMQQNS